MSRIKRAFAVLIIVCTLFISSNASAHEIITAGNYKIEYGWINEPPIAGESNAIVINISGSDTAPAAQTSGAAITITSPAADSKISGDSLDVKVKIDKANTLGTGGHWHLYVNDQLVKMFNLDEPTYTLKGLGNGTHTLKATLSSSNHDDVGQPSIVKITVEGSTATVYPAKVADANSTAYIDVANLKVELLYGSETKTLALKPLRGAKQGQFIGAITPTRPGQYTLRLSGKIGNTDVKAEVKPEEVEPADTVQFPKAASASESSFGLVGWLGISGVVVGLVGVILSIVALTHKK